MSVHYIRFLYEQSSRFVPYQDFIRQPQYIQIVGNSNTWLMVASRTYHLGQLDKRLKYGTHEHMAKCHGDMKCLNSVNKKESKIKIN